jgi:Zn-dependent protease
MGPIISLDIKGIFLGLLLSMIILIVVVAHELAHALTARYFGYKTYSINMYLLGGAAIIENFESNHSHSFWVVAAGPFSNFVMALIGFVAMIPFPEGSIFAVPIGYFVIINLLLGLFNLIPAYPMDGGRILYSVLARFMKNSRAKSITHGVGLFFAGLLALLGVYALDIILIFIAGFIVYSIWSERKRR